MITKPTSTLLSILFFLTAIHCFFTFVHGIDKEDHGMRLELIHKYSPHSKNHGLHGDKRPKTQLELIKELQRHDNIRHQMMSRKRQQNQGLSNHNTSSRRSGIETRTSLALPINSAWDYGHGVYLARVEVGTPAQTFMMIADTGSDLTWLNCRRGCGKKCSKRFNHQRVFQADLSSTFHSVPCSSPLCNMDFLFMFSLDFCPTPLTPCRYDYSYLQQSSALGFFANDTVTALMMNGKIITLDNVLIGCTQSVHGRRHITGGDGILGLGLGRYSFTAKAAQNFGGKFSYCLVDIQSHKNVTGHITFGGKTDPAFMKGMSYTKMNSGSGNDDAFYGVNVQGISVGGKMLNIPMQAWRGRKSGTIIDSGTSITTLTMPAYEPVMAALTTALSKFRNVPDEADPFEFCFNSTGFSEAMVPKLAFHFADGAKFEPQVSGYVLDVAPGRKCIGIQAAKFPGHNVIGNILQQNHVWEFDLVQEKVGFAPSTCT